MLNGLFGGVEMNRVRVQTWNFHDEQVDDKILDTWTLDQFLEDVYMRFLGGWQIKRVLIEKVGAKKHE